jgi:hypothetical protein
MFEGSAEKQVASIYARRDRLSSSRNAASFSSAPATKRGVAYPMTLTESNRLASDTDALQHWQTSTLKAERSTTNIERRIGQRHRQQ